MKIPRIYADTSVIGGCFDAAFSRESRLLFARACERELVLVLSDVVMDEVRPAPAEVRHFIATLPPQAIEPIFADEESERLRDAYLAAGVVGPRQHRDAHHIALATIARVDVLVSWNFKHIVHWDRIRLFNAVNLCEGYAPLEIRSPREVVP